MIKVVSRTKCLLLIAITLAIGVSAKPTFEYVAAKVMDPIISISVKDQYRVAIHESGHAVVAYALHSDTPPTELRVFTERHQSSGGLGYTAVGGPDGLVTSSRAFDIVAELMASMVAEAKLMGDISMTHSDDLARANSILAQICGQVGMCGTLIVERGGPSLEALVQSHLLKAHHRASALIGDNLDIVKALAALVMEQPAVKGHRSLNTRQLADFFASHKVNEATSESHQIAPIVRE